MRISRASISNGWRRMSSVTRDKEGKGGRAYWKGDTFS